MTDEELVRLCKEGEERAFEELIKKYHVPIFNYIYNLVGEKQTTEDLTQETFIKMVNNIEKYKNINSAKFSTWLFTIAKNTVNDHYRKTKSKTTVPLEENMEILTEMDSVEDQIAKREALKEIGQAIESLPNEEKSAIYLRYYMNLSYKEIAQVLSSSQDRVKWKLHDGLQKIRKIVKKKEVNTDEAS